MNGRGGVVRFFLFLSLLLSIVGCDSTTSVADGNETVLRGALAAKVRGLDPGDIGDTTSSLA